MLRIKKLDIFVLKSFLLLFSGTFFICLFIFMMQFLWRYVDELVGKGLEINVLAQFFFLSALTLIPLSLPLAILLAALMTFGNFGERYELLSMKAAGIPLFRIIRPVVLFCMFLGVMSFFFQNVIGPKAQKELWTLLVSMKQKSPEVDIPEGVFYSDIEGYNIYVKKKDRDTGILKDILIYNFSDGFENAHIIWAEEGKLELTADKKHLYLHLYNGEQFENLKSQSVISRNVPYRRETFKEKHTLIAFDTNFEMVDGNFLNQRSDIKNMNEISLAIDSLNMYADSVGRAMYSDAMKTTYRKPVLSKTDSTKMEKEHLAVINTDSILNGMTSAQKLKTLNTTEMRLSSLMSDWNMKSYMTRDADSNIRRHQSDWHKKITLSLACIIFFFIGAPLGAIIRKGGLGMPVVISVILFIFYYIIDNIGFKMARDGIWQAWEGMWLSSAVLAPLGIFLTYKAVNDSVILNADTYLNALKNFIGKRAGRKVEKKEVIIFNPDYAAMLPRLDKLAEDCVVYLKNHKRWLNYFTFWKQGGKDHTAEQLAAEMEGIIDELGNSDQNLILNKLMDYPVIGGYNQLNANINGKVGLIFGLFFPIGVPVYLLATYQRKLLRHDIQVVQKTSRELEDMISNLETKNLK